MTDVDLIPFRVRLRQLLPTSPVMVVWSYTATLDVHPHINVGLICESLVTFSGWN